MSKKTFKIIFRDFFQRKFKNFWKIFFNLKNQLSGQCPDIVRTMSGQFILLFTRTTVRTLSGQLVLVAFDVGFMKNRILLGKTKLNYKIRIPSCEKSEESCFRFLKPIRCILTWFPNSIFKFLKHEIWTTVRTLSGQLKMDDSFILHVQ